MKNITKILLTVMILVVAMVVYTANFLFANTLGLVLGVAGICFIWVGVLKPKSAKANNEMPKAFEQQHLKQSKKEDDADREIRAYEMAIKQNPESAEAYINMGFTYMSKKKDLCKALDCFEKALTIKPYSNDAYYNMGCAYAQMKEFEKAIVCYENAIKYNKLDFEAYWFMGKCYKDIGNDEKQIECVKIAAEMGSKKAQSWLKKLNDMESIEWIRYRGGSRKDNPKNLNELSDEAFKKLKKYVDVKFADGEDDNSTLEFIELLITEYGENTFCSQVDFDFMFGNITWMRPYWYFKDAEKIIEDNIPEGAPSYVIDDSEIYVYKFKELRKADNQKKLKIGNDLRRNLK